MSASNTSNDSWRGQQGVSLLEVLVAVLILSFGLLGIAGLQMTSLRNSQSSAERSVAIMQSYSIGDALRVARDNAIRGDFNTPSGSGAFATEQLSAWQARLAAQLGSSAAGTVNCNGSGKCTITVQWNDERGSGGDSAHSIQTEIQL